MDDEFLVKRARSDDRRLLLIAAIGFIAVALDVFFWRT